MMLVCVCPNIEDCPALCSDITCYPWCEYLHEEEIARESESMVELTQSLKHWLWENHRNIIPLIMFGHLELFTEEMQKEYLDWCQTEDGKQYLKGGSKYKEGE